VAEASQGCPGPMLVGEEFVEEGGEEYGSSQAPRAVPSSSTQAGRAGKGSKLGKSKRDSGDLLTDSLAEESQPLGQMHSRVSLLPSQPAAATVGASQAAPALAPAPPAAAEPAPATQQAGGQPAGTAAARERRRPLFSFAPLPPEEMEASSPESLSLHLLLLCAVLGPTTSSLSQTLMAAALANPANPYAALEAQRAAAQAPAAAAAADSAAAASSVVTRCPAILLAVPPAGEAGLGQASQAVPSQAAPSQAAGGEAGGPSRKKVSARAKYGSLLSQGE
jgi:hypothetical protein